ncbi:MAG: histidine kinase [Chloroflexota bacterium]|nr:histidine kinase [Chloroflexota bacterium]
MHLVEPATETIKGWARQKASDAHTVSDLRGPTLAMARVLWFVLVGLVLLLFTLNIPVYSAFLHLLTAQGDQQSEQLSSVGLRTLQSLGLSLDFYAAYRILVSTFYLLGFLSVAAVLFWRKPENRLALLASFTLVMFPFGNIYPGLALPLPQSLFFHLLGHLGEAGLSLVFYLFPDGRFVPSWTRWLMTGWIMRAGLLIYTEVAPGDRLPSGFLAYLLTVNAWLFPVMLATLVGAQVHRYRRVSTGLQRQQSKWVVFGVTFAAAGTLSLVFLLTAFYTLFQPGTALYFVTWAAFAFVLLSLPLSLGVAILRYRLWDIDLLINRTLVYALLTSAIVALYVLVVGLLGALLQAQGSMLVSVLVTGFVAVLFQPLRECLQNGVNRLMYGERDTPYTSLARLGERLEASLTPETVLATIVETVAQALRLPYAAITLKQGDSFPLVASHGRADDGLVYFPLVYQRERVGDLILSPRRPGESFSPADHRLLDDLCRQVGVAVHGVQLTEELKRLTQDLQHARERLITAREEERRRLRRDLHDGLGPQLSSQALLLTSAQMLLYDDPKEAASILLRASAQVQEAVSDIRRLVYGLRPPALDDLGMVATIKQQLAHNRASGINFALEAADPMPPLPAAVEVACYRIVQEALTNVVRHSHARTCSVTLACADELVIEVCDDGLGLPPACRSGVGLTSMRERAEELGGSWQIITGSGEKGDSGTRVVARLPYR